MTDTHPLRRERERRGWSQSKLAELLGTSPLSISQWERRAYLPSPYFREKLCVLFEKDAYSLGFLGKTNAERLPIHDPFLPLQGRPPSGLVGREALLSSLVEQLCAAQPASTLVMHGLPGVGKTVLLLALTQQKEIEQQFFDGVLWAGLGPHPHLFEHLHRWGTLLHIPPEEMKGLHDLSSWAKSLRTHIGTRKLLLVLDDVWRVEDALALQVGGGQCVHVVTTRFPSLATQLSFQNTVRVSELEEAQGIELLARFVPRLAHQEPEALHRLIQEAGTLPLALTLIGKHLCRYDALGHPRRLHTALHQLQNLPTRLQLAQPQSLIEHHPSLAPEQPLSLEAVIAVSDYQLSPQAQTALRQLALLPAKPNSFSETFVVAQVLASLEGFNELVDAGLVESYGTGRYTLHQTIADYARVNGQQNEDELEAVKQHLVDYAVIWLDQHAEAYAQIEQEHVNLLTALEIASTQARKAVFIHLVLLFVPFWQVRGWYEQAEQYLQRAAHATHELQDINRLMKILGHLEIIEERRGNYEQAKIYCKEALELAQQPEQQEQKSQFLSDLGMIELGQGNYEQAEEHCREALALARQGRYQEQMISILRNLGYLMQYKADYVSAERYYQEGLELARQRGQQEQISQLLNSLASIIGERQGNYEQAEVYYQEGLELARQLGHREYIIRHLNGLGALSVRRGGMEQASIYYREGLELARQLGHRSLISNLLNNMADVNTRLGKRDEAEAYYQEGLELARHIGFTRMVAAILVSVGELRLLEQQVNQAETLFQEALLCVPKESRDLQAYAEYGLAQAAALQGRFTEAAQHSKRSQALFTLIEHFKAAEVEQWSKQLTNGICDTI